MRLRFPTPLHGWRAFLGEVGVVVLGIIIALAADNAVEEWQWQKQAKLAAHEFQQELGFAALVAYEREALQPCLQGRLREISSALARSGAHWSASPLRLKSPAYNNVMPVAYRAPFRIPPRDAWENALATGTLNHLPTEHVMTLAAAYKQVSQISELQQEEQRAAAQLAPLAYDIAMDSHIRADMLRQLAELDRLNALMLVIGQQFIVTFGS